MELSGTGATPGTNFNNGVKLAVKEINAAGRLGKDHQPDLVPLVTDAALGRGQRSRCMAAIIPHAMAAVCVIIFM